MAKVGVTFTVFENSGTEYPEILKYWIPWKHGIENSAQENAGKILYIKSFK